MAALQEDSSPLAVALLFRRLQGYLAHKNLPPPRTLKQDYTQGPIVVLGVGMLLMSEVPPYEGMILIEQRKKK